MSGWDDERARAFAARLIKRHQTTWGLSPGGLGERLRAHAEEAAPGWTADAFAARISAAHAQAGVEGRFRVEEGDRTTSVPAPVREGLNHNQKPFHLWNVERIVEKPYYLLEPQAPYRVGLAAEDDPQTPRGMPQGLPSSSAELVQELESEAAAKAAEAAAAAARRALWEQALPFGQREEEPG